LTKLQPAIQQLITFVGPLCISRDAISVFSEDISTKLGTNVQHVSGHSWKGLQS